jgi:hypothetical protein
VLLIAATGEALDDDERALFKQITGRDHEPLQRVEELVGCIGRRGGKSRAIAALAVYLAGLCDHGDVLAPGERGVLLAIAPDQRQARVVFDYCAAIFESMPLLRELIANRTADTLSLKNNVDIEVRSASFRRLRGHTFIGAIADELAYFFADESSANPDSEILAAVRPGLATTNGPLVMISSPYAKRGELYEAYKRHYGQAGDKLILVAQGTSRDFNPSLPQSVVDRALERDHAAASAEYLAQFRSDIEGFISREQVECCVERGMRERPPIDGIRYFSFTDPSGGSVDSMVCAIGHMDGDILVVDAIREIKATSTPSLRWKKSRSCWHSTKSTPRPATATLNGGALRRLRNAMSNTSTPSRTSPSFIWKCCRASMRRPFDSSTIPARSIRSACSNAARRAVAVTALIIRQIYMTTLPMRLLACAASP